MTALKEELAASRAAKAEGPPRTLYLSLDGVLEPLGRSQILGYLRPLGSRGFPYTLISLERACDLSDAEAVAELERESRAAGIRWIRLPYHGGGARAVLKNCAALLRASLGAVRSERIRLVHARSYVAASVAWLLRLLCGTPYIFDMRGYWVDELADEGRWFTRPLAYRLAKRVERRLVRDAAAVVTLTQTQAEDLRAGLLRDSPEKPVEVITTCADYEEFDPSRPARGGAVPEALRARFEGKLTVGLVGSINRSYRMSESLLFFKYLLEERADAHLVCLTRQLTEMEALLKEHGLPESAYTLACVPHREMPEWLRHMRWALLLLNTRFSKRGSMPTKLAEFFAAGVRPVQYGCNEEVSELVRRAGSGVVPRDLSPEGLREAARLVASSAGGRAEVALARERTRAHFSVAAGAERYERLLAGLHAEVER